MAKAKQKIDHGRISNWSIEDVDGGERIVVGRFLDHPRLGHHGGLTHTSPIVKRDGDRVETENSYYTLVGDEVPRRYRLQLNIHVVDNPRAP